jgi:hypothetical protein
MMLAGTMGVREYQGFLPFSVEKPVPAIPEFGPFMMDFLRFIAIGGCYYYYYYYIIYGR